MYLLCDMVKLKRHQFELDEGLVKKFKPVANSYGYTTVSAYLREHFRSEVKKHERKQKRNDK